MARCGLLWVLVVTIWVGGCAPKAVVSKPVDLFRRLGLVRQEAAPEIAPAPVALGPETPYVPLVEPPRVQRVWIRAALNGEGDLVAGHWVYLMLEPSRWFIEKERVDKRRKLDVGSMPDDERAPGQSVVITPEQLRKMAPER